MLTNFHADEIGCVGAGGDAGMLIVKNVTTLLSEKKFVLARFTVLIVPMYKDLIINRTYVVAKVMSAQSKDLPL